MAHAILPVAQHINKRDIRRSEIKLGKLINSDPSIFVVVVHVDDATCPLRSISHQFDGNMRGVVDNPLFVKTLLSCLTESFHFHIINPIGTRKAHSFMMSKD